MRTELLQKIENHLQFLGYENEWQKNDDDSEILIALHDSSSKPNWICQDFLGGVQMACNYGTSDYAKENIDEFILKINNINGRNGPLSHHVAEDGTLWIKMFVFCYERTAFGKLLETADRILSINLGDEEVSEFMI